MSKKIFITGEIGINHNGDIGIAKKLIDTANFTTSIHYNFVQTPEKIQKIL